MAATIEKIKLVWNRSFIEGILYFLKTVFFFNIYKVLFYLRIFHVKYCQCLVLIHLQIHLIVQAFEDPQVVHRFYHQVLFAPCLLFLVFLLLMFLF